MKFICLKYRDRNQWNAISEQDRRAFQQESLHYDDKLRASGHFFSTESLACTGEAVGLSSFQGQLVVADDKSRHDSEQLEGLMFLEARDLNHAIILVSDHPGIRAGWFKIHPADEKGAKP
jgi:hypothetical protein